MVESNYLLFYMLSAKMVYSYCFYLNSIFDKIQDGCQDGDLVWWRHRPLTALPPIKYTSSCREKIKGFPLRAKSFRNTAMYPKVKGGGGVTYHFHWLIIWSLLLIWHYKSTKLENKILITTLFHSRWSIDWSLERVSFCLHDWSTMSGHMSKTMKSNLCE